jgi:hypothetical protein
MPDTFESRIYVDNRLQHMLDLRFNIPFFQRGQFPTSVSNGSQEIVTPNPWVGRGNSAPFDQRMCNFRANSKKTDFFVNSILSYSRCCCGWHQRLVPRRRWQQAVAQRSNQWVLFASFVHIWKMTNYRSV